MILAGACLAVLLILLLCAGHGSYSRQRVEVSPDLPTSATSAGLHLRLVSHNETSRTGVTVSGILSRKNPVMFAAPSNGRYDEERLTAIRPNGFVVQFVTRDGKEAQTNFVLFPFGHTTETNALGWMIVGNYGDNMESRSSILPTLNADGTFHLLTTKLLTNSSVGGGSAR